MKNLLIVLFALQLTSCCMIGACSSDEKVDVTPVEASDKPLPDLNTREK